MLSDEISHPRAHHYKFANNEARDVFFADPEMFLVMINTHGSYILKYLWNEAADNCDYLSMEGLVCEVRTTPNKFKVFLITMPPPENCTEVYYVAAAFRPGAERPYETCRYFTLEKVNPGVHTNGTLLCEWNEYGGLTTMGVHPGADLNDFYQEVEKLLN